MELTKKELQTMITTAIIQTREECEKRPPLSQRQMQAKYGAEFNRYVETGMLKPVAKGSGKNGKIAYLESEFYACRSVNMVEARAQLERL